MMYDDENMPPNGPDEPQLPYVPNPILFGVTPRGGVELEVTEGRGGMAGYIAVGLDGPEAEVAILPPSGGPGGGASPVPGEPSEWVTPSFPFPLMPGMTLRLTRTASGPLSVLRLLAPLDTDPPPQPSEAPGTGQGDTPELTSGVPFGGINVAAGQFKLFTLTVPEGASNLLIVTTGGDGNADLLVAQGVVPLGGRAQYVSANAGSNERLSIDNPAPGQWYIMLQTGAGPALGITLTATVATAAPLTPTTDQDGYVTLNGATVTTDENGYQTIQNATATVDQDGYATVTGAGGSTPPSNGPIYTD